MREAAGITREHAAWHIRGSGSKISRMELGSVGPKRRDIADLADLYGADDDERADLLALTDRANGPVWWSEFSDVLPSWFQEYVGLEHAAARIRFYEVQLVPGLLQTEAYARAVMSSAPFAVPAHELEQRVSARMTRQRLLTRPNPPDLVAVVEESALRRTVGGCEVMRAQLEHLIKVAEWPNVTLQVMPIGQVVAAAEAGAFTLLHFDVPDLADMAYTEQLTRAVYLNKPEDVQRYVGAMDDLRASALDAAQSARLIADLLEQP